MIIGRFLLGIAALLFSSCLAQHDNSQSDRAERGLNARWGLTTIIVADQGSIDVLSDTEIYLDIREDDSAVVGLAGLAGCNHYVGNMMFVEQRVTISSLSATEIYCGDEALMEQEERYLSLLGSMKHLKLNVSGYILRLMSDTGDYLIFSRYVPTPTTRSHIF